MKDCLDYEELYINYFKKLLELKESGPNENAPFGIDHANLFGHIPNIPMCDGSEKGKRKMANTDIKKLLETNPVLTELDTNQLANDNHCNPNFKGKKPEKNLMRKGLLTKLELCNSNDENYDLLFEELIDMEESSV